jgi:3'-5' exoribonuclease
MEPHQKTNSNTHLWVKDIKEEDPVRGLYLVRVKRMAVTRKGDAFMGLTLADRTGEVEARVWERVNELSPLFTEGDIIEVSGHASSYRNRIQITLSDLKVPKDMGDPALFLEVSAKDTDEMMGDLKRILKEIKNSALKALVKRFLSDHGFMSHFKQAPAAKNFHHSYLGGLLEHTLSVCQMSKYVVHHYPELDGDILITGAFLHDIGKSPCWMKNWRL